MVKRWLSIVGREIRGLHEAAYLLGFFALMSLILALVRDKLFAYTFGAGDILDVYYAAFRIPDILFVSVGSLVSASIVLPYFIERFGRSREEGREFSDALFSVFFALMAVASAIAFVAAPYLIPKLLPGFANDPALPSLILSMRIMLASPFLLGMSNLFSSLTQMRLRFLVYAASPVVYNAGIILGLLFGYPLFGVPGLALGVAFGALLHVGIQVPFIVSEGLFPRLQRPWRIRWAGIREVALVALPRVVTLSANQLASFFLISLASLMTVGSISVFNFAWNLQSVPLVLIGASYSSAVFPTLSRLYFEKNMKEFLEKVITSAQHIIFWSMPITVLFIVLRAQIVRTVLGAGAFDWSDTRLTAAMLAIFAVSTIGQSLIVLFVRSFYAEGKTRKPLLIGVFSALLTVILGYTINKAFFAFPVFRFFLEDLLKVSGQPGTSVLVLALAFSIGIMINAFLHWCVFARAYRGFTRPVLATLFHSFAASVIMGYAAYLSLQIFAAIFPLERFWGIFMQGFLSGMIGIIVLVLTLRILENKELAEVWTVLHRKFWRTTVPPAEVEHL